MAGGNPQLGDKGGTRFLGLLMGQNQHALPAFDTLFKTLEREGTPPKTIIELGTSHGGFSLFLHLYSLVSGAHFVTYDRSGFVPTYRALFQRWQVDYRQADVLHDPATRAEIAALIAAPGQTVLLCDNGDKVREFALYAPYLKPGDLVLAHDYCIDTSTFERDYRDRIWSFCEVTEADIEPVCQQCHLTPFLQGVMALAVWACRRKHDV